MVSWFCDGEVGKIKKVGMFESSHRFQYYLQYNRCKFLHKFAFNEWGSTDIDGGSVLT